MPKKKDKVTSISAELEKPVIMVEPEEQVIKVDSEDQVDLEDNEESMEEEVEYEEVEEFEEFEEEDDEDEEDEEDEENDEETTEADRMDVEPPKNELKDQDINNKHAELLALPPHGSEVYVGGIPHEATEDDLRGFFEVIGEVTEVRIMKGKDSGEHRGYAFVAFNTKEFVSKAIDDLNNTEFMGKKLKVSASQAKNKLFIGNIPRTWTDDDLKKVVTNIGPGVEFIELVKDLQNSKRNRGFAFIEYYNHACAEFSRKSMSTAKFKLDSNTPTVSWADQKSAESTSQIKAIYVKNLPKDITQDQLKELFRHHGKITKLVLPPAKSGHEKSRYGFVHFADRSSAMMAIKDTEKYELDGQVLECSLAKPPTEKKSEPVLNSQKPLLPTYPLHGYGGMMGVGYGFAGNYGVPAPFGQTMMYGRGTAGSAPAGVAMVPMVLPDGRLGYVLQQPGVPVHPSMQRGGSRGGSSSATKPSGGSGGRRYHPY